MKYTVLRTKIMETSVRLEKSASELKNISGQLKNAVAQILASNQAQELSEYKEIYDGSADAALMQLVSDLEAWSSMFSAIYQEYYEAQIQSCEHALRALNNI